MSRPILVSVIIPTYHDWERLQKCVNLLATQSFSSDEYEVIIVNNDPEDFPPKDFFIPVNFKHICEKTPGSYAARNAGLKNSQGQILAFTDSDCLPHTDWLKNGVEAILDGGVERVAGCIKVYSKNNKMTAAECYDSIFAFDQETNASYGVAVTGNLLARRDIFEKVGLFNEKLFSGGDSEWNRRATASGYNIQYCDNVVVSHPARHTWSELASKVRRVTGGKITSNPKYKLSLIRSLSPPIEGYSYIARKKTSLFRTKVLAFFVAYRIKIYRYFYFRKLKNGRCALERT